MERFLLAAVLCIISTPLAFGAEWNYDDNSPNGPSKWTPAICQDGKRQSPIDIKSTDATKDSGLGAFILTNYDMTPANAKFTAKNNGHALVFALPENVYNVSGGGLTGVYTTAQFHLHWGSVNTQGSEHFLDGHKYAAELHFVSYNTKYANLSMAAGNDDGLAVLGVLIKVEGGNNSAFDFLENAKNVMYKDNEKGDIAAFKLKPILPADQTKYFRYPGSLTTPECQQSVTWTVFNDAVKISEYQINLMRMLKGKDNATISNNYRPIQMLNTRTVKASFDVPTQSPSASATPSATPSADASAISMTAGLFLMMLLAAIFVR
ncbi:hypothetical protein ACROYT_G010377 [Oculina patagonica]